MSIFEGNDPMITFIIIWVLWFLSEILLNRLRRANYSIQKDHDRGTMRLIWLAITLAIVLSILAANYFPAKILAWPYTGYAGLTIILAGMAVRFLAVWSLGSRFTVNLAISEEHRIKTNGMYRWIRHPSYLGSIISFIGFSLSLNNAISLVVIMLLVVPSFLYRIRIEERLLINEFGTEYQEYMRQTRRLIPWIY